MPLPLILGTNALTGGYEVANSLKFNDGSSDHLNKTLGTASNRKIFTVSYWIKKTTIGLHSPIVEVASSGGSIGGSENAAQIYFNTSDQLTWYETHGGGVINLSTNRVFRDPTAWYHIMYAIDTTQGTEANRLKLYVNGVQDSDFTSGSGTYPAQNLESYINSNQDATYIGRTRYNNKYFEGYMCEVVHVDGTALANTDLGEFDSDSPNIWKPVDVSGLTFGTNGFYLDFEDGSSLGNDAAGSNNFTVNNLTAVDQVTDTCTNNSCTFNPLYRTTTEVNNGALVYNSPASNPVFGSITTFGVNAGKWYAEVKYEAGASHYGIIGICDEVFASLSGLGSATNTDFGKTGPALGSDPQNCTVAYVINTGKIRNNNVNQNYGSGGGDGDIISIALDRDNRKVYFAINGTYENSGNPGAGSNGFDLSSQITGDTYFLGVTNDTGSSETILDFNFGAGFGKTAVSSSNSDANGHGNFEYAVPSGFFAWNSKNLAEQG